MSDHFRVMGIHDNHNASVCLLEDGKVVFCLQEERINGIKNFNGFPHHAMQRALQWANLTVEDIDIFALGALHNPAWKDAQELIKQYSAPQWKKNLTDFFKVSPLFRLYKSIKAGQRKKFLINAGIPINKIRYYHHHTSHAAAALYSSGFEKVPSLILTLDGGGDDVCAGVYSSEAGNLSCIKTTREGHSVGNIYGNSTFYMGMSPLEHEYKLMGMAPYSKTKYFTKISQSLDGLLDVNGLQFKRTTLSTTSNCYHHLERIYQRQRFDAICGGLQDFAERKVLRWVKNAIHETGIHRLCLSGGVFMNVKMNKLIAELPEVEELFIMPSCGDESNAIGASYLAYEENCFAIGKDPAIQPFSDLYLGESFSESVIKDEITRSGFQYQEDRNVNAFIAEMLSEDKVVARCSGRSEWGARALGNRSILANPASFETVQKINDAIKMRDFWMPFAGTVPEHEMNRYLINPKNIPSPYMMMAFDTTDERETIRAATHPKDHTIRPQILTRTQNPGYYNLIEQFSKISGIGCVLNTSFNLHGSPMVYHPREALDTLRKSDLQVLVMDKFIVTKKIPE